MKVEWNHDPDEIRKRLNEKCIPDGMLDAAVRRLTEEGASRAKDFLPLNAMPRELSGSLSFQMSDRLAQDLYDIQRRQYPGPEYFEGDGSAT